MRRKIGGPVVLWGPAAEFQPWIAADVELIRMHLQRKYGATAIIYHVCSIPPSGYWWMSVGV